MISIVVIYTERKINRIVKFSQVIINNHCLRSNIKFFLPINEYTFACLVIATQFEALDLFYWANIFLLCQI